MSQPMLQQRSGREVCDILAEYYLAISHAYARSDRAMGKVLASYYESIIASYQKGSWKEYNASTLALFAYSRHIPVYFFFKYEAMLFAALAKHSTAPLLSWLIEYGFRTGTLRTREAAWRYRRLSLEFEKHRARGSNKAFVVMRAPDRKTYRLYSYNLGYASALLQFSSFGQQQATIGYAPDNFLRLIALLDGCRRKGEAEKVSGSTISILAQNKAGSARLDTCELLARQLKDKLSRASGAELDSAVADLGKIGVKAGVANCLASIADDTVSKMVTALEEYQSCRARQAVSPSTWKSKPEWVFDGTGNANDWSQSFCWDGTSYDLEAIARYFSDSSGDYEEVFTSKDGTKHAIARTEYVDGKRGDTKVKIYDNETGNLIEEIVVGPDNTLKSINKYDANGNWQSEAKFDSDGRMTEFRDSQGAAKFTYNEDGTTTVETKTENEDGSTTTVTTTIDSAGNTVSSSTSKDSSKQPPDEYYRDECLAKLFPDPREGAVGELVTKLQTQILPNPESPVNAVDDPCFSQFESSSPTTCVSVALCIEGAGVDENCQCTKRTGDLPKGQEEIDRCAQIRCSEGYMCDPATGTCRMMGSGPPTYVPGVVPDPKIRLQSITLPPVMPRLADQLNLFRSGLAVRIQELRKEAGDTWTH